MRVLLLIVSICLISACGSKEKMHSDHSSHDHGATKHHGGENAEEMAEKAGDKASEVADEAAEAADSAVSSATSSEGEKANCKLGEETRSVFLSPIAEGGCEVIYTKGGESSQIATAKYDNSYCEKVYNKVRTNLEAGGWTCE